MRHSGLLQNLGFYLQSLTPHSMRVLSSLLGTHKELNSIRFYASKQFDLAKIVKANKENSSIDGVKKKVKASTRKSKPKVEVNEEVSNESGTLKPEWISAVLQSPMYKGVETDSVKQSEFKNFVEELDIKYLPSVSTVIKKTESKSQQEVLKRWMEEKTKELGGEQQFQKYQKEMLDKGLNLHECIKLSLQGETDFKVRSGNEGHWESIKSVLGDVSDVKVMEEDCVHPEMFYRGKFDCIAQLRDTLCLIEWKTSSKHKPLLSSTYDNPLQVAAYIGAVNRSGMLKKFEISNLTQGALVIAYPSGEPATVHLMNQKSCEKYWKKWLERLYHYWALQFEQKAES